MSQQSDSEPMSQLGKMNAALPQVARNDFDATDEQYFSGNARLVRLRPPLPHECTSQVEATEMIGMHPMIVVMRQSPESAARPITLVTLNQEAWESITGALGTMGDDKILGLLRDDQKTLFRIPPRWFFI